MADQGSDRAVLERLCERLRQMSEGALTRSRQDLEDRSIATSVHELCAWAVGQQGRSSPVPVLHPLASGDQLAVIGREFLVWAAAASDPAVPDPAASGGATLERWRSEIERLRSAT